MSGYDDQFLGEHIQKIKLAAFKERNIYLWGQIDENMELIVNRQTDRLLGADLKHGTQEPIYFHISSEGGSVFSSLSIISKIELLRDLGYRVGAVSYGICMSGALFIYMTASDRFSQKHTRFMLHQPRLVGDLGIMSVESSKRLYKDMDEIWARLRGIVTKYTKIDEKSLDDLSDGDHDHFFFPEEGVELGVVDKII